MVAGVTGVKGFTLKLPAPNCQYAIDVSVSSTPNDPVTLARTGAWRSGCMTRTWTSKPNSAATTIETTNDDGVGHPCSWRRLRNTNAVYMPIAP